MDDARSFDDLRRYWDEIARGEPASPGDLDPDLAATIRRLHALDDVPPDPAYARQLRETIMHASELPLPAPFSSPSNGARAVGGALLSLPAAPSRREPRRFWSLLATAALIALTVVAGFAAIGGLVRDAARSIEPPGIPDDRAWLGRVRDARRAPARHAHGRRRPRRHDPAGRRVAGCAGIPLLS